MVTPAALGMRRGINSTSVAMLYETQLHLWRVMRLEKGSGPSESKDCLGFAMAYGEGTVAEA